MAQLRYVEATPLYRTCYAGVKNKVFAFILLMKINDRHCSVWPLSVVISRRHSVIHAGHSVATIYTVSEPTGSASQYWLDKMIFLPVHLTLYQGTLFWTYTI